MGTPFTFLTQRPATELGLHVPEGYSSCIIVIRVQKGSSVLEVITSRIVAELGD